MSKKNRQREPQILQEGYQPTLAGLMGKDGQPLQHLDPKKLKPPKGDTAIQPPKPAAGDKA
jgi:hypothetical protein